MKEPQVTVDIAQNRPFFILGEVAAPGQYPYVPNMSVESAVAIAGGFSPRAKRDRVTLTHSDGGGPVRHQHGRGVEDVLAGRAEMDLRGGVLVGRSGDRRP